MKVWIFQTGEPLHCDGGNPRPMRAMNLANVLVERGHQVVLWSSAFYHQEKRYRSREFKSIQINESLVINLIPSCGYNRNIGVGRLVDHAQLGINLSKLLKSQFHQLPDVAFVGYPPIEKAAVALRWLKKRGVPSVIDLKDQWPSLFLEPFPRFIRFFVNIVLFPYFIIGRQAVRDATCLSSMSMEYLQWVSKFSKRELGPLDNVYPLTVKVNSYEETELRETKEWWIQRGVNLRDNRRFCFIGSFMSVFDFIIIKKAINLLGSEDNNFQIVMAGDGGSKKEIEKLFKGLKNVIFPGWIDAKKIHVLSKYSRGAIIPYKNIDNFTSNIPNKVIDSLSNSLPIVTTLKGAVETLIKKYDVGFVCENDCEIKDSLKLLLDDQSLFQQKSSKAYNLYLEKFEYNKVYEGLSISLENLAELHGRQGG